MKKIFLLIILILCIAAMLEATIITDVTEWVKESNTLLIEIGVLIGTGLALYLKIRETLGIKEAKDKLANIAKGLMTKAEEKPSQLLQMVTDAQSMPKILNNDPSPEVKESLVRQVFVERNPELLKKAKLKDLPTIVNFLANVYQGAKPMLHLIRKK